MLRVSSNSPCLFGVLSFYYLNLAVWMIELKLTGDFNDASTFNNDSVVWIKY